MEGRHRSEWKRVRRAVCRRIGESSRPTTTARAKPPSMKRSPGRSSRSAASSATVVAGTKKRRAGAGAAPVQSGIAKREASAPGVTAEGLANGLVYADGTCAGFTRRRRGASFHYLDLSGRTIRDPAVLARIRALAIPPAYESVWICPDANGHLQAHGRDARGRKQYRYHAQWRETRDATKYHRTQAFGEALPRIRACVKRDLAKPGLTREKVLATVISLLDSTLIRIGNADYARDNKSYGLTTLRHKHVAVKAGALRFQFRGKSGVEHDVPVGDPKIARIIRRCMALPGHDLFQYRGEDGQRHSVDSTAINDYLRTASGGAFTAKDYRTWAASVLALSALQAAEPTPPSDGSSDAEVLSNTERHRRLVAVIREIAARLGNTPSVCRKCYIHPAVIEAFESGALGCIARVPASKDPMRQLSAAQRRLLKRDERAFACFLLAQPQGCAVPV